MGKEVMIVSVGKTRDQTLYSIKSQDSKFIIFVVSSQTFQNVEQIKRESGIELTATEQIFLNNVDCISKCYKQLTKQIPEILKRWDKSPNDVIVDFTGGTKAMTAALVLATIEECSDYFYISGQVREGEGNRVKTGTEMLIHSANPWDEMGVQELNKVDLLFEKARYQSAVEVVDELIEKLSIDRKEIYRIFRDIISGYLSWDSFKHEDALKKFSPLLQRISKYKLVNENGFDELIKRVEKDTKILEQICKAKKENGKELILDLVSNSARRLQKENKYDDAAARLYSALERIAKFRLLKLYSIDNSATKEEQIPKDIRDQYKDFEIRDGVKLFKYGFRKSFELLYALGDEMGKEYFRNLKEINKVMSARNNSILAHGTDPVNKDVCESMFEFCLKFGEIKQNDLYTFDKLYLRRLNI